MRKTAELPLLVPTVREFRETNAEMDGSSHLSGSFGDIKCGDF